MPVTHPTPAEASRANFSRLVQERVSGFEDEMLQGNRSFEILFVEVQSPKLKDKLFM